jgi:beta-galactosidase
VRQARSKTRRCGTILALVTACCLFTLIPSAALAGRDRVLLDTGWKFSLESARGSSVDPSAVNYDDSSWKIVNVPHDYVIEQPFTRGLDPQHASLPTPASWYRKTIVIPRSDQGKELWLDFDGIFRDAKIYVNGKFELEHQSGYTPIHIDITPLADPGMPLTIAIHVDPAAFEGWWYEGGGIYRHVWLTSVEPVHIEPEGVWVDPKVIGNESRPSSAIVDIRVTLKNSGHDGRRYRLIQRIISPSGYIVESQLRDYNRPLAAGAAAGCETDVLLSHPQLWSLETPYLYRLETSLDVGGSEVDRVETEFGVRTCRFDANKGFFLNGKSVKIEGFCNHQDFAGIGIAVPDNLEYWRVKKMMALGANAWRTAHNPPTESLLDACDKLGVLVLDENRHLGETFSPKTQLTGTHANNLSDLDAMIVRDRNHACVFAWSLCNEEPLQGTDVGAEILKKMVARAHELDPSRLATTAMNGGWGKGFSLVEDLQGFNYLVGSFSDFHKNFPNQPMIFTESTSAVSDRGIYENDWGRGYLGSYTETDPNDWINWLSTTENRWTPIAETDYLSGDFVWAGFDYKGEPSPVGWPDINSHFGVLDMCGFPKDDAYYYMAYWGHKPLVHITPNWNLPGSEGKPVRVIVFSSAPRVELLQDGVSLGAKDCPFYGHAEWTVTYRPGMLEARAFDSSGKLTATDRAVTAGVPCRIKLKTDLPAVSANGEDESVIDASIVDEDGNLVPIAANDVAFSISGPAGQVAGTGNGDPADHTPDASSERHAFSGCLAAIVRSTGKRGTASLTATSIGLQPARISIRFE